MTILVCRPGAFLEIMLMVNGAIVLLCFMARAVEIRSSGDSRLTRLAMLTWVKYRIFPANKMAADSRLRYLGRASTG